MKPPLPALTRSLIYALTGALLLSACRVFNPTGNTITGSGNVTSETRPVSGIEAVALLGLGDVVLTQGSTEGLTIEAEDNLLPLISSPVKAGTLELGFDRANWADSIRPTRPIRFLVSVRDLSAVDVTGSGNINAAVLNSSDFEINLTGSGNVTLDSLTATDLRVVISGSGNVSLAGTVDNQDVTLSGSGDYTAGDLESQAAGVTLSGSGNITAWVQQELNIVISGSGTVNYYGQPSVPRHDIAGSGDINPLGAK